MNLRELLMGESRRLSHVKRYSSIPVNRGETVAEHSFYVTYYSLLVAGDLLATLNCLNSVKESTLTHGYGLSLDWQKLLGSAMLHDISECMTGDIVRQVKHDNEGLHQDFLKLERKVVHFIENKVEVKFFDLWRVAKDDSLEGRIVAIGDALSVVSYAIEEYLTGNAYLLRVLEEVRRDHIVNLRHSIGSLKLPDRFPELETKSVLLNALDDLDNLIGEYLDKEPFRKSLIRFVTGGEDEASHEE
jgi:5'-deoxynucleotidase YfbR-like HD superfamily hydrolase